MTSYYNFSVQDLILKEDEIDLLMGEDKEAETETVMQILLKKKKVFKEKTGSEKYRVVL